MSSISQGERQNWMSGCIFLTDFCQGTGGKVQTFKRVWTCPGKSLKIHSSLIHHYLAKPEYEEQPRVFAETLLSR
jgi:hypothetical protein